MRRPIWPRVTPFLIFSIALLSRSSALAHGASATTNVVQDPAAVAAIQAALTAMGGAAAAGQIQDSTVQGAISDPPPSGRPDRNFSWKTLGGEFRNEINSSASSRVFVSGHGVPADLRDGTVISIPCHVARAVLPFHLPALVLLTEVSSPQYTLTLVGPATVNGTLALQVHTSDDSDTAGQLVTPQEWYFDSATGLPLRVEYRTPRPDDAQQFQLASMDFAQWQAVNGVLAPFQIVLGEGQRSVTVTVSSVVFNSGLSPTEFDLATGGSQ